MSLRSLTVETARKVRDINVEGELPVQGLEHLVRGRSVEEVDTRANVGASDEADLDGATGGGNAVSARVVGTIKCAVGCAGGGIGAKSSIPTNALKLDSFPVSIPINSPSVTSVAVGGAPKIEVGFVSIDLRKKEDQYIRSRMQPTPVSVEHDGASNGSATAGRAGLPGQGRMGFGSEGADLLSANASNGKSK